MKIYWQSTRKLILLLAIGTIGVCIPTISSIEHHRYSTSSVLGEKPQFSVDVYALWDNCYVGERNSFIANVCNPTEADVPLWNCSKVGLSYPTANENLTIRRGSTSIDNLSSADDVYISWNITAPAKVKGLLILNGGKESANPIGGKGQGFVLLNLDGWAFSVAGKYAIRATLMRGNDVLCQSSWRQLIVKSAN